MIRRFALVMIVTAGCSYAAPTCNSITGTLGAAAALSGCLNVGSNVTGDSKNQNLSSDGLWVNPSSSGPNGALGGFQAGGLSVAYTVTNEGTYYQYQYTLSNTEDAVSHIVLGLGNTCATATTAGVSSPGCIFDLSTSNATAGSVAGLLGSDCPSSAHRTTCTITAAASYTSGAYNNGFFAAGTIATLSGASNGTGDPGIPNFGTRAVQIAPASALDTLTITFDSVDAPVWEDIYIRDDTSEAFPGNSIEAFNNSAAGFFVAAPGSVVPEPGFYGLMTLGMAGLFFVRQRTAGKRSNT